MIAVLQFATLFQDAFALMLSIFNHYPAKTIITPEHFGWTAWVEGFEGVEGVEGVFAFNESVDLTERNFPNGLRRLRLERLALPTVSFMEVGEGIYNVQIDIKD
jgi:hypothetical protein